MTLLDRINRTGTTVVMATHDVGDRRHDAPAGHRARPRVGDPRPGTRHLRPRPGHLVPRGPCRRRGGARRRVGHGVRGGDGADHVPPGSGPGAAGAGADADLRRLRRPRDRDESVAEPDDGDRGRSHRRRVALARGHGPVAAAGREQRARPVEPERGSAGLRSAEGIAGRDRHPPLDDRPDAPDPHGELPRPLQVL